MNPTLHGSDGSQNPSTNSYDSNNNSYNNNKTNNNGIWNIASPASTGNLTPKTARIMALEAQVTELQRTVAALNSQSAQLRASSLGYLRSMNEYSAMNVNMRAVEINRIENELNNQLHAPHLQTYLHMQTIQQSQANYQQQQIQPQHQNQQQQQQHVQSQHHQISGHIGNQNVGNVPANTTTVTAGAVNRASVFKLTNSTLLDPPPSFMPPSSSSSSPFQSASLSRVASTSTELAALSLMPSNSQHQFFCSSASDTGFDCSENASGSSFGGSFGDNGAGNVQNDHDRDTNAMLLEDTRVDADNNDIDNVDMYSNISTEDRENDIQLNLQYPYDERFTRGSNTGEKFSNGNNLSELHDPNSEIFFKALKDDRTAVTVEQISAFNDGRNPFRRGGRYLRRRHCENLDNYRTACTLTLSRRKVRKEFVIDGKTPGEFYEQDNWWLVATSNNMPFPIVLEHPIGPRFCRIGDIVRTTGRIDGTDDVFVHFWSFELEFISEVGRGGMPKFGNVLFEPEVGPRIYWIGKEGSKDSFDLCTAVKGFVAEGIERQRLLEAERKVAPAVFPEVAVVETDDNTVTDEHYGAETDSNDEDDSGDEIDGENVESVASDEDEADKNEEQSNGIESKSGVQSFSRPTGLRENNGNAVVEFQEMQNPSKTPEKNCDVCLSFSTPKANENASLFSSASFGSAASPINQVLHRLVVSDDDDECNDIKDTPPAKTVVRQLQRQDTKYTDDGLSSQQTLVNSSQRSVNEKAGESKRVHDNTSLDDSFNCSVDSSLCGSSVDLSKIPGELSPIFGSATLGTYILSVASPHRFAPSPLNPLASRGNSSSRGSPALKRKNEDQHSKVTRNESFLRSEVFGKDENTEDEINQEN
ncbi:hypothetical protein HK100_007214 [Physocladia obscura]|uniref:Uncharacterized protein n=1 Tax=Physocladia obscura TaxID=109957 RepID=A0AAD5SPM4_9FUNG|nr:hypothetical protein HK100_007214 [Physocladia obscura]